MTLSTKCLHVYLEKYYLEGKMAYVCQDCKELVK